MQNGALLIVAITGSSDVTSDFGIASGACGADIVVAAGCQSFGVPLSFGGSFMLACCCHSRKVCAPDSRQISRRGFLTRKCVVAVSVLTLATREQHTRRERKLRIIEHLYQRRLNCLAATVCYGKSMGLKRHSGSRPTTYLRKRLMLRGRFRRFKDFSLPLQHRRLPSL